MTMPSKLAATGITYRQYDFWVRQGYLRPQEPFPGSGCRREWTNDELAVAIRMAQLVKAGLSPAVAADIARGGNVGWLSPRVKVVIDEPGATVEAGPAGTCLGWPGDVERGAA